MLIWFYWSIMGYLFHFSYPQILIKQAANPNFKLLHARNNNLRKIHLVSRQFNFYQYRINNKNLKQTDLTK